MINTAAKLYFGLSALASIAAIAYWVGTGERSGGWLLFSLAVAALVAGLAVTGAGIRDTVFVGGEVEQERVYVDRALQPRPSPWPLIFALAAGLFAVGLATGHVVIILGIIGLALAVAGGFAQAFREDPSHTASVGLRATDRAVAPFLLPVGAFLLIAVIVLSVSRVLLAVPKAASVGIAFGLAMVLLLGFAFIASRPRASSTVLAGLAGVAILSVLAAGGVGAATGERKFEKHVPPPTVVVLVAHNISFNQPQISVPANKIVTVRFVNLDHGTYHNVGVYTATKGGSPIVDGQPVKGIAHKDYQWTFTTPGQFAFRCDFHPQMIGIFVVTAGGTAGGTGSTP
jgi:plastocyanin